MPRASERIKTMGFYNASPFAPTPTLLVQGRAEPVFGSFNDKTGVTLGYIISDSAATTTATVVFQVASGNAPAVGSYVTITGSSNSAGIFNVTNAQILTSSITEQGVATITFAISSTTQASAQDGGQVAVPQPKLGDALTSAGGASVPVTVPASPSQQSGKSISATVTLPSQQLGVASTLSAVTVVIQGSNSNEDGSFNTIGTITAAGAAGSTYDWQSGEGNTGTGTLAAGSVNIPSFRFLRLNVTGATGAGPIYGTIMI
jgi:hypothetical protein